MDYVKKYNITHEDIIKLFNDNMEQHNFNKKEINIICEILERFEYLYNEYEKFYFSVAIIKSMIIFHNNISDIENDALIIECDYNKIVTYKS